MELVSLKELLKVKRVLKAVPLAGGQKVEKNKKQKLWKQK
jgi:hypothetical protein